MLTCPQCSGSAPAGSRYCPACAGDLSAVPAGAATQTSVPVESSYGTGVARRASTIPSVTSYPSFDQTRFLPGAMLVGRYRIVGPIGKGGMGEVYRADDLKLGQPVALKFLPEALNRDEGRLRRFLNEVKTARQVSHPNVCRAYDVGEIDGQHFLSMEYVDGEDLASLLRRIGRLPHDRAVRMARQLCAGLAAAHDQGILHRDLKPGNVLVDGTGRAKITDFGLAGLAEEMHGAELRAGTPGYMAPEQIQGKEVSVRSDLYSLGLVLYELFTGERPYRADTQAEMARLQQESTPTSPSSHVANLDPAVESIILRCLDPDPANRPATALAVSAALPGGDPLAAALAAGETPSPELVAAAGAGIAVKPWLAWTCLAVALLGLPIVTAVADQIMLFRQAPLEMPVAVLEARAHEITRELGIDTEVKHSVHGFQPNGEYYGLLLAARPEDWTAALAAPPGIVHYWYRQSPQPLVPQDTTGLRVGWEDPPHTVPGMVGMRLDSEGRLVQLRAAPQKAEATNTDGSRRADWSRLLSYAGLESAALTPVEPDELPPFYADERVAWKGRYAENPEHEIRVDAAAFGGKPVFLQITGPWTGGPAPAGPGAGGLAALLIFVAVLGGALWFARWNLRRGRGDRRGATRLAVYVVLFAMVGWVLGADHVAGGAEIARFSAQLGFSLLSGALLWVLYLALEPLVRRRFPDTLIGWARLLDGQWRDPLVGRDLVLGGALAVSLVGLDWLSAYAPRLFGLPITYHAGFGLDPLLGGRRALAAIVGAQFTITFVIVMLLIFIFAHMLLKRTWAASIITVGALTLLLAGNVTPLQSAINMVFWAVLLALLLRFGLLAAVAGFYLHSLLSHAPMTASLDTWYADFSLATLLAFLAVTLFGFYTSFGGRPIFGTPALADD